MKLFENEKSFTHTLESIHKLYNQSDVSGCLEATDFRWKFKSKAILYIVYRVFLIFIFTSFFFIFKKESITGNSKITLMYLNFPMWENLQNNPFTVCHTVIIRQRFCLKGQSLFTYKLIFTVYLIWNCIIMEFKDNVQRKYQSD